MRLEGKASMLQKRQNGKTAPTNSNSDSPKGSSSDPYLSPFPTGPPILNNTISNNSALENSVGEGNNGGVSGLEMVGLAVGALTVIGLIGLFVRKRIISGNRTRDINDTERNSTRSSYMRKPHFSQQYNEQDTEGKYSPTMVDRNDSFSRRTYDSPPPLKKFYSSQSENSSSRNLLSSSPTSPQSPFTPNPQQQSDPSYPSYPSYPQDSHIGPSQDDDSSHLVQQQFTSNYQPQSPLTPNPQQKELPYPPNSYGGPSQEDHLLPYSPQSPYSPYPQQREPPYPPNSYGGPSQDDHPSPFLPQSSFIPNPQQRDPLNSYQDDYNAYGQDDYNSYGGPSKDDYPSPYLLQSPNTQQSEQSYQQNSYREPQNDQIYENSQHFHQQYPNDPIHLQQTQGTLLSSRNSYQLQQSYRSPPHTPLDPPYSPFLSKSEPVSTNDQDISSSGYQDNLNTPIVPLMINDVSHEIVGDIDDDKRNSDIIKNELKDLDEMIANAMPTKNLSYVSDSSFSKLLSDIPITPTNEKSNRPESQTSSVYSVRDNGNTQMENVQPTQEIEMASENKVTSSNPSQDLSQLMQPAAMGFIEPTQSNMIIEQVSELSEVQSNMTQPTTTWFAQPSQSNVKPVAAQVSSKPLYDLDGIKKHAEKVLNTKVEKNNDLDNKSDSERVTKNDDNENVIKKNDENQGEPLVRKKSVRFRTENSNQEETQKVSNPKKSILINRDDARNIQDTIQLSSKLESEDNYDSKDEKVNNRRSNTESYQVYDFDVSSYQDDT